MDTTDRSENPGGSMRWLWRLVLLFFSVLINPAATAYVVTDACGHDPPQDVVINKTAAKADRPLEQSAARGWNVDRVEDNMKGERRPARRDSTERRQTFFAELQR